MQQQQKQAEKNEKKTYNAVHNFNTENPLLIELGKHDNLWIKDCPLHTDQ